MKPPSRCPNVFGRLCIEPLEPRQFLSAIYGLSQISAVGDTYAGYAGAPSQLTPFEDGLLYQAPAPGTGRNGIYFTQGTRASTRLLPLPATGDVTLIGVCGDQIYFSFADASEDDGIYIPPPYELYVTSDLGRTITDLGQIPTDPADIPSTAGDGEVYFALSDGVWESDGTPAGTRNIIPTPNGFPFGEMAVIGNHLLLESSSGIISVDRSTLQQQQIGTATATVLTVSGSQAYFCESSSSSALGMVSLWSTDGTPTGTVNVPAEVPSGSGMADVSNITIVGNQLFIIADPIAVAPSDSRELYSLDIVSNVVTPLAAVSFDSTPVDFDGQAVFIQSTDSGNTLWASDGTVRGTRVVSRRIGEVDWPIVSNGMLFGATSSGGSATDGVFQYNIPGQLYICGRTASLKPVLASTSIQSFVTGSASTGTVQVEVINNGSATITGNSRIDLLMTSTASPAATSRLRSMNVRVALHPGDVRFFAVPIGVWPKIAAGSYQLMVRLTAPDHSVTQTTGSITVALVAPVVAQEISSDPWIDIVHGSANYTAQIQNDGNSPFNGKAKIEMYTSTDGRTPQGSPVYIHAVRLRLAVFGSQTIHFTVPAKVWNEFDIQVIPVLKLVDS